MRVGKTPAGMTATPENGTNATLCLLTRWRPQPVPGVADLVVMHVGRIIGRVEVEGVDIQPSDCAEERIGRDDPVALGRDLAGAGVGQILLRIEDIDGGALSALRLSPHPL